MLDDWNLLRFLVWSTLMFNLGFWIAVAFHHHLVHIARKHRKRWPP